MQKILSILFTAYKNYVVYIPDIIWVNIILVIRLLVMITLYKYLYKNYSENDLIMWYSLIQVTYAVIITQVVVTSKPKINMEISNDVKSWKIAVYLLNPINYILYKFLEFFPVFMQNIIFWLIFWLSLWFLTTWFFPLSLWWFIWWLILLIWSMLIVFFSYAFIWILAFYTEDVEAFRFVYSKFEMIFWWNILPIPFLPWVFQTIAYILPFAYFWYTTWLVFVSFDFYTFIKYFLIQLSWLLFTIFLCFFVFKKASKKLVINWG